MCGRRPPQRGGQIVDGHEVRTCGVHVTWQACRGLLEKPAVAIRIMEGGVRSVAAVIGVRPADSPAPKQEWLIEAFINAGVTVERAANLDTQTHQSLDCSPDVRD